MLTFSILVGVPLSVVAPQPLAMPYLLKGLVSLLGKHIVLTINLSWSIVMFISLLSFNIIKSLVKVLRVCSRKDSLTCMDGRKNASSAPTTLLLSLTDSKLFDPNTILNFLRL